MNLSFNTKLAEGYSSNSQIARILTEDWVQSNSYCPGCGDLPLGRFKNNRPVADFYCNNCSEEFELKSKSGNLSKTISDGAYSSMIERINSENNPNFFFLSYNRDWSVQDFLIIPKQFFTSEIIIKRPPLSQTAKRAGWIGCNIDISKVADFGKVFLVKRSKIIDPEMVNQAFKKTLFLRGKSTESKGWMIDVMKCLDEIKSTTFSLNEIYQFEAQLQLKYPNNNFIKDKIRQQLQMLRDKGLIEFVGRGIYRKI
ncbi:MAG: restriction endonuclease [Bacteroidia bacterium]|nr:restriction endonuclease [Bacteroidia bacterium]